MKKFKVFLKMYFVWIILAAFFIPAFIYEIKETTWGVTCYHNIYTNRKIDSMYKYLDTTKTCITDLSVRIDTINKKPALILFGEKYIKIISDQKNMQNINFEKSAQGSGFWINDSIMVTAEHVIGERDSKRKMIVFGDTLSPKIVSTYYYDVSVLIFPKGTAKKKYHYTLIPKGYKLDGKFGIIKIGYSKMGKVETVVESKAHILNHTILDDIKKSKWNGYPMALSNEYLGYIIYPIGFQEANHFGGGTSGGPVVLKKNGLVCGVVSGVVQTNNIAFCTNGSVNGIYYLLDKISNNKN